MATEFKTYLVSTPGDQTAESVEANEAIIEASGVLAFYITMPISDRVLIRAFAIGTWKSVSLSIKSRTRQSGS